MGAWWDSGKKTETLPAQKSSNLKKEKNQTAKELAKSTKKEIPPEEASQIQDRLHQIIARTSQLQSKVNGNRADVYKILETAKIHERLLQTVTVPTPVRMNRQVNVDEILRREKLRLIAERTRQTQNQLELLERTRNLQNVQVVQTPKTVQPVRPAPETRTS